MIRGQLPRHFSSEEISRALDQLISANTIVEKIHAEALPAPRRYFRLPNYDAIPIRETIRIGDIDVPRLLSSEPIMYYPETFNEAIERLAQHSESLQEQFQEAVREEHRRYWADVVGLFGIFASVIALVVATLPNIALDTSLPLWQSLLSNLAVLLPIAVVLGLFVVFARWVVR
jgi:hypothetical protein